MQLQVMDAQTYCVNGMGKFESFENLNPMHPEHSQFSLNGGLLGTRDAKACCHEKSPAYN
jgi:hypothetical protein